MSNYSNTKATIAANVYTNHNNEVTAEMVKAGINAVVDTLIAGGFIYKGVATTSTNPGSPDANVFYIATAPGTYTNFGSLVVNDGEVAILKYNGSWSKEVTGAATAAEVSALGQKVSDISTSIDGVVFRDNVTINGYDKVAATFNMKAGKTYTFLLNKDSFSGTAYRGLKDKDGNWLAGNAAVTSMPYTYQYTAAQDYPGAQFILGRGGTNTFSLTITESASIEERLNDLDADIVQGGLAIFNNLLDGGKLEIELGGINTNGTNGAWSDRLRMKNAISTKVGYLCVPDGFLIKAVYYYSSWTDASTFTFVSYENIGRRDTFIKTASPYFRLTFQNDAGTSISVNDLKAAMPSIMPVVDSKLASGIATKADINIKWYIDPTSPNANDLEEIYIPEKLLEGISIVNLSAPFSNQILAMAKDSGGANIWVARIYTAAQDGIVQVLPCVTAGGNAALGMPCVYLKFKDAAHFNNNPTSGAYLPNRNLDLTYIKDLRFAPSVSFYINDKEAESSEVGIALPPKVYAVVGDTLQLFHKSIVKANNYRNYSIVVSCDYGKNYPRYYEFTPTSGQTGTKTLTYKVYNNRNEVIAEKSTQLVIVAKPTSNATQKNILTLGASDYTDGAIVSELNRRLTASSGDGTPMNPTGLNLPNISFIGRKEVEGIHQEASGGWGWKTFASDGVKTIRYYVNGVSQLNIDDTYSINGVAISSTYYMRIKEINVTEGAGNILCEVNGGYVYNIGDIPASGTLNRMTGNGDATISYTSFVMEDGNPLWHNGAIDFANYSDVYCGGVTIDAILTNMGVNDFGASIRTVDSYMESYVKPLIRAYHNDYPAGKFYVGTIQMPDTNGGIGANSGASSQRYWYNYAKTYWHYLDKLVELVEDAEFSPYVILVDVEAEFDSEYLYPYIDANVNNRCQTKERLGTNAFHPVFEHRKPIADSYYRCLCAKMFV